MSGFEFEVEELRDVIATALIGLDDDAEPPEVVVAHAKGGNLHVTGVVYHPRDNTIYLHTSSQRTRVVPRYRYGWEDLYGAARRQEEDEIRRSLELGRQRVRRRAAPEGGTL